MHRFKAKDSEIVITLLCLCRNISKDFYVGNINKAGLKGYAYHLVLLWYYYSLWYIRYSQVFNEKIQYKIKCFLYSNDVFWLQCIKSKSIETCFNK